MKSRVSNVTIRYIQSAYGLTTKLQETQLVLIIIIYVASVKQGETEIDVPL